MVFEKYISLVISGFLLRMLIGYHIWDRSVPLSFSVFIFCEIETVLLLDCCRLKYDNVCRISGIVQIFVSFSPEKEKWGTLHLR